MASVVTSTAADVKPLKGARIRRFTAGGTVTAGYPVYVDSSGYIQHASGTAVATNLVVGVAVQTLASGDRGDVVTKGPISNLSGATPGGKCYTMNLAAGIDHTGGTKKTIVGVAESTTVLLVMPHRVSNS